MPIARKQTLCFSTGGVRVVVSLLFVCSLTFGLSALRSGNVSAFQEQLPVNDPIRPTTSFSNPATITIPTSGNASLYPSAINVSGLSGNIANTPGSVKVTLNSFSHVFPEDVGVVLVGPTGAALLLQKSAGGQAPITSVTYSISDDGTTALPAGTFAAGTFKPASYVAGESFPAPGPGTSYNNPGPSGGGTATFSSTFGGTAPNGQWNLFIRDFGTGDAGSISGGWSLDITTAAAATFDR